MSLLTFASLRRASQRSRKFLRHRKLFFAFQNAKCLQLHDTLILLQHVQNHMRLDIQHQPTAHKISNYLMVP
jgi:hypothetical protein